METFYFKRGESPNQKMNGPDKNNSAWCRPTDIRGTGQSAVFQLGWRKSEKDFDFGVFPQSVDIGLNLFLSLLRE